MLEAVEVGLPSSSRSLMEPLVEASGAEMLLVAREEMWASFLFTSLMSSGWENGMTGDDDVVTMDATGRQKGGEERREK